MKKGYLRTGDLNLSGLLKVLSWKGICWNETWADILLCFDMRAFQKQILSILKVLNHSWSVLLSCQNVQNCYILRSLIYVICLIIRQIESGAYSLVVKRFGFDFQIIRIENQGLTENNTLIYDLSDFLEFAFYFFPENNKYIFHLLFR